MKALQYRKSIPRYVLFKLLGLVPRFHGELTEDRQQKTLCLARPGPGHHEETAIVNKSTPDGLRLVVVGRIVDHLLKVLRRMSDRSKYLLDRGIQSELRKGVARFVSRCALDIWQLVDYAWFTKQLAALLHQSWVANMVRRLNVIPQGFVQRPNSAVYGCCR